MTSVSDRGHRRAGACRRRRASGAEGAQPREVAQAAQRLLDAGEGDADFLTQKVVTAKFYAEQLLPQAAGLASAVTAGPGDLQAAIF